MMDTLLERAYARALLETIREQLFEWESENRRSWESARVKKNSNDMHFFMGKTVAYAATRTHIASLLEHAPRIDANTIKTRYIEALKEIGASEQVISAVERMAQNDDSE